MHPTPYPDHNRVLEELLTVAQSTLDESFLGAYLQGSFAVGGFDRHSDCDFIIVVKGRLTAWQVDALQSMHARLYRLESYWAQHLEGSYYPQEVLKDYTRRGTPLWYLDNGASQLVQDVHCNTIVVRQTLRQFGVTLAGPPPTSLIDPIPVEDFRQEMLTSMHSWGEQILSHPEQYNNRFYQGFIVLHYCRVLHDLYTGLPGSKPAAADWAKATLDPAWQALIDRTWATRPLPEVSVRTPADPDDFEQTLRFVRYALELAGPPPDL
jgi:hypothetical protein